MQNQKGFSLIEVLLSLALAGILGIAVPGALSGALRATTTTNQHTIAENLARNQMDYIQNQPYDSINNPPLYNILPDLPDSYNVVTPMATRLDPKGDGIDNDDGLQEITVAIQHGSEVIFNLTDFKVNFNP